MPRSFTHSTIVDIKHKKRLEDVKNFKKFRDFSLPKLFSTLDTVEKIKNSIYYKELNPKLTSKTPDTIESLQELLKQTYLLQDSLKSFILNQLKNVINSVDFDKIIEDNKKKAKSVNNVIDFIKNDRGENNAIKIIMYTLLFQYFYKFEIKPFIPVFINVIEDVHKGVITAFTLSKLYYLQYGKYLPVILVINLGKKCPHAINFICLPSQKVLHQFNNVIVDTSSVTADVKNLSTYNHKTKVLLQNCRLDFLNFFNKIKVEFKKFSILFKTKPILRQTRDLCVADLQGKYGTCVNYSLGITLNCLFQQDYLTQSILKICNTFDKKNNEIAQNVIITIGKVSHLFHKFIRQTMLKKYRQIEYQKGKAESIYNSRQDDIEIDYEDDQEEGTILDSTLQIPIKEAFELRSQVNEKVFNDKIDKLNKIGKLDNIIINIFNEEKSHDEKTLKIISRFLKKCKKAIHEWDIRNLNKKINTTNEDKTLQKNPLENYNPEDPSYIDI